MHEFLEFHRHGIDILLLFSLKSLASIYFKFKLRLEVYLFMEIITTKGTKEIEWIHIYFYQDVDMVQHQMRIQFNFPNGTNQKITDICIFLRDFFLNLSL